MTLSEFVTLTVKFLSGHSVPVGIKPTRTWHLLAAVFSHCSLATEKTATNRLTSLQLFLFYLLCVLCRSGVESPRLRFRTSSSQIFHCMCSYVLFCLLPPSVKLTRATVLVCTFRVHPPSSHIFKLHKWLYVLLCPFSLSLQHVSGAVHVIPCDLDGGPDYHPPTLRYCISF